jgi:hypothetical protein
VEEVSQGLQRLDYYLLNVTNEQRYLYARTARHLRTAESTHARTLWYMLLICGTIILASFVQVRGDAFPQHQQQLPQLLLAVAGACAAGKLQTPGLAFAVRTSFRHCTLPALCCLQVLGVRLMFKSNRKQGLII